MNESHKTPTHTENHRGHETSDANVSSITKFGIGLAIITAVVIVLMLWLQDYLRESGEKTAARPSPLAGERQPPPAPRLQIVPEKDLQQVRVAEDSLLHSYGWVIRDAGVVRIPIDRAIELVAQRGLPVRAEGAKEGTQQ